MPQKRGTPDRVGVPRKQDGSQSLGGLYESIQVDRMQVLKYLSSPLARLISLGIGLFAQPRRRDPLANP